MTPSEFSLYLSWNMWLEIGLDAKLVPYHCWKGYFIHPAYNTTVYTLQYVFFFTRGWQHWLTFSFDLFKYFSVFVSLFFFQNWCLFIHFQSSFGDGCFCWNAFHPTKLHPFSFPAYFYSFSGSFKILKIGLQSICSLSLLVIIWQFNKYILWFIISVFDENIYQGPRKPTENIKFHNKLFVPHLWGHFLARLTKRLH